HGFRRARDGTFTTFDAPGSGTGPFQGTIAFGLNLAGVIAEYYADASNVNHGFLRSPDGSLTTFDVPGAGTGSGPGGVAIGDLNQGTFAENINPAGAIAGFYRDASNVTHGFLRTSDGTFKMFDAPAARTGTCPPSAAAAGLFQGTFAANINPAGAIPGTYIDANGVSHGFLRAADGTITTFDAPGAGTGSGQGTFPFSNNPAAGSSGN